MIRIVTTTKTYLDIEKCINSVERLNELVIVTTENPIKSTDKIIRITDGFMLSDIEWNDTEPPYLFPKLPFTETNLLALVFYKLGNYQKAITYVSEHEELFQHLLITVNLLYGYVITHQQLQFLRTSSIHNLAIVYNVGITDPRTDKALVRKTYEEALLSAKTNSLKLFSIKHYVTFLLDNSLFTEAEVLLRSVQGTATGKEEKNAMHTLLATALMGQLTLPYNVEKLLEIADLQVQSIGYYQDNGFKVNAGLVLIEASEIASYQNDFSKAKDFINKAILYFKEEDVLLFMGEATLQKAILLYTWSKNGSPQYYKPAITTFQNALKVFKRDTHPLKFAEIHHNLALIYSEIQVSETEKAIWTAFCASSFKEALNYYTKDKFPYQFAMISHNYATALMGFPEAKLHSNLDKSFHLFEDSLSIRTAKEYPFERALTLLNQLELYWMLHNETTEDEVKHIEQMQLNAHEIKQLVTDKALLKKANEHLSELEKIKIIIT